MNPEGNNEDRYVIKYSVYKVFQSEELLERIREWIPIMDKITTEAYHLLNLHILRLCEESKPIPELSSNYLQQLSINFP